MSNQLFPTLMPVQPNFFSGESASPEKLTAINDYIQAAFYIIENYMGNGIDYRVTDDANRKMLFNVSGAIGKMGRLYKPVNQLRSIEFIAKNYAPSSGALVDINSENSHIETPNESALVLTDELVIPISQLLLGDYWFGLDYKGSGIVTITFKTGSPIATNISSTTLDYLQLWLNPNTSDKNVECISIKPDAETGLTIFGIYVAPKEEVLTVEDEDYRPMNTVYATSPENGIYWKVAKPCAYAVDNSCPKRTCSYCIGNIYDTQVNADGWIAKGEPVCAGDNHAVVDPSLVPHDGEGTILTYVADTTTPTEQVYTIQSPLLMQSNPFAIKFSPIGVHNEDSGTPIEKNSVAVYDIQAGGGTSNPIYYDMAVVSAGRPDIVFVNDTKGVLSPSTTRVQVLNAQYGISEMLFDLFNSMGKYRTSLPAVYAD